MKLLVHLFNLAVSFSLEKMVNTSIVKKDYENKFPPKITNS